MRPLILLIFYPLALVGIFLPPWIPTPLLFPHRLAPDLQWAVALCSCVYPCAMGEALEGTSSSPEVAFSPTSAVLLPGGTAGPHPSASGLYRPLSPLALCLAASSWSD